MTPKKDVLKGIGSDPEDGYYNTHKAASILGCTTETIRDWIARGKIQGYKVNGRWVVKRSDLMDLMRERHG